MFTISDSVHIHAPIERCFLLSTSIELMAHTLGMKPLEGKSSGLVVGGDKLLWAGLKFGFPQMHEILVTEYEAPRLWQETMQRGRFRRFQYDHHLVEIEDHTLLNEKLRFSLAWGWAGDMVGQRLVMPHISKRLRQRMHLLKRIAESEEWRHYLPDTTETH